MILSLLALTVSFTALVLWVYWPGHRSRFEAQGRLVLDEDVNTTDVQVKQ